MSALAQLQNEFQNLIVQAHPKAPPWIESRHGASAQVRLNIYHHAYRARLLETLADTFAHTCLYLGETWFEQLALQFVEQTPSTQDNIGLYGGLFPDFLQKTCPQDQDIAELAELDWTLRRAFDGPDAFVLTKETLAELPPTAWENFVLKAVPTLKVLVHRHNTLEIWQALDQDQTPPASQVLPQTVPVLTWRKGHSPHFRSMNALEHRALALVQGEQTFGTVCEKIQTEFPEVDAAPTAGSLLAAWLQDEILKA